MLVVAAAVLKFSLSPTCTLHWKPLITLHVPHRTVTWQWRGGRTTTSATCGGGRRLRGVRHGARACASVEQSGPLSLTANIHHARAEPCQSPRLTPAIRSVSDWRVDSMRWFTLTGLRTVLSSPELRCETSGNPQKECGRTEAARPEPTGYLLVHVPENLVASSPCLQNRSGAAPFPLPAPSLAAFHHCNLSILIHDGSRHAGGNKNNPLKAKQRQGNWRGKAAHEWVRRQRRQDISLMVEQKLTRSLSHIAESAHAPVHAHTHRCA